MRPTTLALVLILSTPFLAARQAESKPEDKCAIEGVVVKSTTGQPLKKALVMAQRIDANDQQHGARTDASGRFTFQDLNPGNYNLWASREGYLFQSYGQETPNGPAKTLTLRPGQRVREVVFRLVPMGAITGRVYDEDGEPVSGVNVQAMQYTYANGRRQLTGSGGASTNDLGEYRLVGLAPQQYYLSATYSPWNPTDDGASEAYAPVYFPGTNDPSGATPVEVRPGEDLAQVDFTLLPVRAVRVRGRILSAALGHPGVGINIALIRRDTDMAFYQSQANVDSAQGTYELRAVPPGSYVIFAQLYDNAKQFYGREMVEVGNSDIDGLDLVLGPGSEVRGHIRVEGNAQLDLAGLRIGLLPHEQVQMGPPDVVVEPDGSFTLKNVPDGPYQVNVCCPPEGFYLKAAHLGSEDALENDLNLRQTQRPGSLDLVLSPAGGRIEGIVRRQQEPFRGATIVLVPEANRRSQARLYRTAGADPDGRFTLQGISPGDYQVFAWEKVENVAYQDPDFLHPYEGFSEHVRVEEGSRIAVQVELIPADEGKQYRAGRKQ